MRTKIALLIVCVAGMLVVFALLAFTYAPHIIAAASTTSLDRPAQIDNAINSAGTLSRNMDNAENSVLVPVHHIGSACDADSGESASIGY